MDEMTWGEFKKRVDDWLAAHVDEPDAVPIEYIDISWKQPGEELVIGLRKGMLNIL